MSLPVVRITRPSDLKGQQNGQLEPHLLSEVQRSGRLHHLAARAFNALAMHAYAHAQGMGLTFTHGGTYRSFQQQFNLFTSRYEQTTHAKYLATPSHRRKKWDGAAFFGLKVWWVKKKLANGRYPATAATPGSSNHGLGLAIDTAYDHDLSDGIGSDDATYIKGHPGWPWLLDNAHRFGFAWELQSEPWHINYVAGDSLPQAVLDWEAFAGTQPTTPLPPPTPGPAPVVPPTDGERKMKWLDTVRQGQSSKTVQIMQLILFSLGYSIQADGQFGAQTAATLRTFQQRHDLQVDAICGPKTWNALASDGPRNGEFDRG